VFVVEPDVVFVANEAVTRSAASSVVDVVVLGLVPLPLLQDISAPSSRHVIAVSLSVFMLDIFLIGFLNLFWY
jgi:hypothetical protein